ncbi:MAG: DNA mismatch repair endonuclease MutL [Bacteriovoracia bacterium]
MPWCKRDVNSTTRILRLPDQLANQIAAGEVVERPGAALKELMENSLDAGATQIRVHLRGGGIELLEVADDGSGIHAEDLPLALDRHATSKISKPEDLFEIRSWGFRGEALASIAAVSRLSIASRRAEANTAREIVLEGGTLVDDRSVARTVGTTVRVQDLFYNTPARKKFLKSTGAETAHCWQTLHRLALGSPEVQFEAWQDGEKAFHYPATKSREERIVQVYREAWNLKLEVETLLKVEAESFPLKLRAWILPSSHFIPSSRGILTFVNQRSVKDKLLQQAILAAAKETLFGRVYPQLVFDLEMPANYVDVNVHPTKAEVRFREPGHIFGFLRKHLEKALAGDRRESVDLVDASGERMPFSAPEYAAQTTAPLFSGGTTQFHQRAAKPSQNFSEPQSSSHSYASSPASFPGNNFSQEFSSAVRAAESNSNRPQFLGTLRNTYLVCQDEDGLLLVDQHAAHERVTYERLKRNRLAKREGAPLLIPIQVELPRNALDRMESEFPKFAEWGLSLDRTGPTVVAVRELPALLLRADGSPVLPIGEFLRKLCQSWEEMPGEGQLADALLDKMLEVIASESCHGSVRAGRSMAPQEAYALLEQMSDTDFSGHCPHGRPTTLRFKWGEIERMFKRTL